MSPASASEHPRHDSAAMGNGATIDGYRIVRRLGSGGMATVLLVEEVETGEQRAMKIHHSGDLGPSAVLRLKLEFRAMARLDHPGVVKVLRYGVHEGRPFLVMDLVRGKAITRWQSLQPKAPSPQHHYSRILDLAIQTAEALEHIHARGVIHRDLKPDNLLVTAEGRVKLLDFGVAQEVGQSLDHTHSGLVIGTLAYASPEQVAGREVDHRTDLYSLGVVLYELLTGERPFAAEHVAAFIIKHITEPPIPPIARRPDIPPALNGVVLNLMAKDAAERPRTAGALVVQLQAIAQTLGPANVTTKGQPRGEFAEAWVLEPSFAGRSRERALLAMALKGLADGRAGVRFIVGETGVGKGRLLKEALADARGLGLRGARTRFFSDDGRNFGAFDDLIAQMMKAMSRVSPERLKRALGPSGPLLARAFPAMAEVIGVQQGAPEPRGAELDLMAAGLTGLLKRTLKGPTLLSLEQAEWADASSALLLESLAGRLNGGRGAPLLLVISVRSEGLGTEHPLQRLMFGAQPLGPVIQLGALSSKEITELVASMLGDDVDAAAVGEGLEEVSGGNPLFIAETIRYLVEDGQLAAAKHAEAKVRWRVTSEAGLRLPKSFSEVVRARVGRLSPSHRRSLAVASVLGRSFGPSHLAEVAGLGEDALLDFLEVALQRHLLVERANPTGVRYYFYHQRVRELVYQSLGPQAQRGWHREAAAALRRSGQQSVELTAAHLFAAGDFTDAARLLHREGEASLHRGDSLTAGRLLRRAQECVEQASPPAPRDLRFNIQLRLGSVNANVGALDEAEGCLMAARELAQGESGRQSRMQVDYQLARLSSRRGDVRAAGESYQRAIDAHQPFDEPSLRLKAQNGLAGALWQQGEVDRARQLFEEVKQASRACGLASTEATAINGLGLLTVAQNEFEASIEVFREARALFEAQGLQLQCLLCDLNVASSMRALGDLGPSRQLNNQAREAFERLGNRLLAATSWLAEADVALDILDLDSAVKALRAFDASDDQRPLSRLSALRLQGMIDAGRGRPGDAARRMTLALTLAQEVGEDGVAAEVLTRLGECRLALGSPVEAVALFRQAAQEAEACGSSVDLAVARVAMAKAVAALGDAQQAVVLLDAALPFLRAKKLRMSLLTCLAHRAELATEAGERALAVDLIAETMDVIRFIRAGLEARERRTFDGRPEIARAAGLFKRLHPAQG